jgi:hypothetical protein
MEGYPANKLAIPRVKLRIQCKRHDDCGSVFRMMSVYLLSTHPSCHVPLRKVDLFLLCAIKYNPMRHLMEFSKFLPALDLQCTSYSLASTCKVQQKNRFMLDYRFSGIRHVLVTGEKFCHVSGLFHFASFGPRTFVIGCMFRLVSVRQSLGKWDMVITCSSLADIRES